MKVEGDILEVGTWEDQYLNKEYRVTIKFKDKPKFHLGKAKLTQD